MDGSKRRRGTLRKGLRGRHGLGSESETKRFPGSEFVRRLKDIP